MAHGDFTYEWKTYTTGFRRELLRVFNSRPRLPEAQIAERVRELFDKYFNDEDTYGREGGGSWDVFIRSVYLNGGQFE